MSKTQHKLAEVQDLFIRAGIAPTSANDDSMTVEVVAATPTKVRRYDWRNSTEFDEELVIAASAMRLERMASGLPIYDDHKHYQGIDGVLGITEGYRFEGEKLITTIRFDKSEKGKEAYRKVKEGIIKTVSVGYKVHGYERNTTIKDGEIPIYRATSWEPMELSLAPIPADIKSSVRNEQNRNTVQIVDNNMNPIDEGTKPVVDNGEGTQERSLPNGGGGAAPVVPMPTQTADLAEERKRSAGIIELAKRHNLDQTLASNHISSGTSLDAFRALVLDELEKRNAPITGNTNIAQVTADERDKFRKIGEIGIGLRTGMITEGELRKTTEGQAMLEAARPYRGIRLARMAEICLENEGVNVRALLGNEEEIVGRAITSSQKDFVVMLAGTANRRLRERYALQPRTWEQICRVGSYGDFRKYDIVTAHSMINALKEVTENGEYTKAKLTDGEVNSIQLKTKGLIFNLSRQAIINDDLGHFTRLVDAAGDAAGRSIELDLYALINMNSGDGPTMPDGNTLFHASHGNKLTAGKITIPNLDLAMQAMMSQKAPGGEVDDYLDIQPNLMLIPPALKLTAMSVLKDAYDHTDSKLMKANPLRDAIPNILASYRVDPTNKIGWYLFADKNIVPTFEVGFLNGVTEPYLEQRNAWSQDGVEWKTRLDYGLAAIDWRGAVRNPGQA